MIWIIRAGLLAVFIGVLTLAFTQTSATPSPSPSPTLTPESATIAPTRVPLPTMLPQAIISRVSRDTPGPFATSTPSGQPRVSAVDNGFVPPQMVVPLGSRVTWVNGGSDGHDVTGNGPGGAWRSGTLAPMERYERLFGLPGTYDYVCTIHPEMRGRIVVQP